MEYWRKLYTRARISKQGKYIKLPSVSHCVLELLSSERQVVGAKGFLQDPPEL